VKVACLGSMNDACLSAIVRDQIYDLVEDEKFEDGMIDFAVGIMVAQN
jgi:hypothetical protein